MELLLSGLLSKYLTDVVKWLADKGQLEIPDIGKKLTAFILSMLTTYVANLGLPGGLGESLGKSLGALQPALTGIIVTGLSFALHDLLDWLATVAGNLQPKPAPARPT